jgi:REP element-mobilizing transposase RayT
MLRRNYHIFPLAYHITFTCYGTRLHGCEAGSIDRFNNHHGTPMLSPDPGRYARESDELKNPPYFMDEPRRKEVMHSIKEVCSHRGWVLLAAHVRTSHLHAVVEAIDPPEKVMNDFKSYASRRLNNKRFDSCERKRWSRHGSTTYKWTTEEVVTAIDYVVNGQGDKLEVFEKER